MKTTTLSCPPSTTPSPPNVPYHHDSPPTYLHHPDCTIPTLHHSRDCFNVPYTFIFTCPIFVRTSTLLRTNPYPPTPTLMYLHARQPQGLNPHPRLPLCYNLQGEHRRSNRPTTDRKSVHRKTVDTKSYIRHRLNGI